MTETPFVERDCTIEFQGKSFTSGGAMIVGDRAIGYLEKNSETGKLEIRTWHGEKMGNAYIVSTWKLPRYCFISDEMMQVEAYIENKWYTGRTCGIGMLWKGKVKKGR